MTNKQTGITKEKNKKSEEQVEFKGKYINSIGKRKTATARIRLYKDGKGNIVINEKKINQYFDNSALRAILNQPLKLTGHLRDFDISILTKGGGKKTQSEAIRHGIARVLIEFDKELKPALKAKGWTTRDARKKERKKPGLKKARKAPQWSKR